MATLSLIDSKSGKNFRIDDNNIIMVLTKNSETVIQYTDSDNSLKREIVVDETASAVAALSSLLIALTFSSSSETFYLNKNKIVSYRRRIDESGSELSYDNLGKTNVVFIDESSATIDGLIKTVKVWRGLITQSLTGDPTDKVLQNELGGTINWSRIGVGNYHGTLNGAFPADKVFVQCLNSNNGNYALIVAGRSTDNIIEVWTGDPALGGNDDGRLTDASLEIRVFS